MSLPSMDPLLWNKAVVLLIPQIRRRIDKALTRDLRKLVTVAVVDGSCLTFERKYLFVL